MTIHYSDGRSVKAALLKRTETTMRVAIQGSGDVAEFSNINGAWVSAECDLVRIEFEWQLLNYKAAVSEADCSCSYELAAHLIHLLFTDSSEDRIEMIIPAESRPVLGSYHLPI